MQQFDGSEKCYYEKVLDFFSSPIQVIPLPGSNDGKKNKKEKSLSPEAKKKGSEPAVQNQENITGSVVLLSRFRFIEGSWDPSTPRGASAVTMYSISRQVYREM